MPGRVTKSVEKALRRRLETKYATAIEIILEDTAAAFEKCTGDESCVTVQIGKPLLTLREAEIVQMFGILEQHEDWALLRGKAARDGETLVFDLTKF